MLIRLFLIYNYLNFKEYRTLKNFIGKDLKKTGRCDFTIAKELFLAFGAGLALPKHVETEFYTRGQEKHSYSIG